jgi:hypothetical protein
MSVTATMLALTFTALEEHGGGWTGLNAEESPLRGRKQIEFVVFDSDGRYYVFFFASKRHREAQQTAQAYLSATNARCVGWGTYTKNAPSFTSNHDGVDPGTRREILAKMKLELDVPLFGL